MVIITEWIRMGSFLLHVKNKTCRLSPGRSKSKMYYSTLTQRVLAALEVDNLKEWLSCHTEELVGDRGSRIGCPLATYLRDSGFAMPWVNHSDLQVSDPDR